MHLTTAATPSHRKAQHFAVALCNVLIPHPSHMPVLQPSLWQLSREAWGASQALEQLDSHRHTTAADACASQTAHHKPRAPPGEQPPYFKRKSDVQQAGGRSVFAYFLPYLLLNCKAFPSRQTRFPLATTPVGLHHSNKNFFCPKGISRLLSVLNSLQFRDYLAKPNLLPPGKNTQTLKSRFHPFRTWQYSRHEGAAEARYTNGITKQRKYANMPRGFRRWSVRLRSGRRCRCAGAGREWRLCSCAGRAEGTRTAPLQTPARREGQRKRLRRKCSHKAEPTKPQQKYKVKSVCHTQ